MNQIYETPEKTAPPVPQLEQQKMNTRKVRKSYVNFIAFLTVLCLGLSVLSVAQTVKIQTVSKSLIDEQKQNSSLTSELKNMQSKNKILQKNYNVLKSSQTSSGSSVTSAGNAKIAYLTFDDGPSKYTPRLLDILKENSVKATFFIAFMKKDTDEKRAWIKRAVDEGHVLGVHSWTHDYHIIYSSEQNFMMDFNKMKDIIVSATGVQPKVCRFPGGIGNTVSITNSNGQIIMPKLVDDVEKLGIKPFDWNAGGEDAEIPTPTKDQLVREILQDCRGKNKAYILMHDTHAFSVDAVSEIVSQLKSQGYTFETLSPDSPPMQQPCRKTK